MSFHGMEPEREIKFFCIRCSAMRPIQVNACLETVPDQDRNDIRVRPHSSGTGGTDQILDITIGDAIGDNAAHTDGTAVSDSLRPQRKDCPG